jgi:hypothetical protein
MKKVVIALVLSMVVVTAAEHKASAWCLFKVGGGFNMTLASGPSRVRMTQPMPYPPCFGDALGGCYYPYAGYGYPPPALTPPLAPLPPIGPKPLPKPTAQGFDHASPWGAEYQPVNYLSPIYQSYAAYWYGR